MKRDELIRYKAGIAALMLSSSMFLGGCAKGFKLTVDEERNIVAEDDSFINNDFIEKCYFPDWLKKIKPALTEYLVIKDDMTMQEICYLTTIAFYFEKEKNNNE